MSSDSRTRDDAAFNGTRKLVRPHLPPTVPGQERRRDPSHNEDPLTHALNEPHTVTESSHAEAFYFQKQVQQQTEMTVILEDGEELQGVIEWFDKCVIKLRLGNRHRVMVYKGCVKYLFKTSELHAGNTVMK